MVKIKIPARLSILLLSFLILQTSCREQTRRTVIRPVRALQVEETLVIGQRVFPGRTRALNRVNLSFRVSGPLIKRPVIVGDRVKKEEVVARIDPRDFLAALKSSQGDKEKTEARLRFAKSDYERAETVWNEDPGAISVSYLDQKREERNQLAGGLKAINAQVKSDRDALDDTYLRSPFDGIVVATYVENFEYVRAEQPIMRILDLTEVEMMIDIPEALIKFVPQVKDFVVRFDAFPGREFNATVKEIGTEASRVTRTYPVTLVMKQPEDVTILAGMAGDASVAPGSLPGKEEAHFIVPPSATFSDKKQEQTFVWIYNPQTKQLERREVVIGSLTSMGLIVESGLTSGEWVVTSGVSFLSEGETVELLPVELNSMGEQIEIHHKNTDEEPVPKQAEDDEEVGLVIQSSKSV
ncbi:MAG: efflux RND transporter periplasmic adaptor subunit [Chlamydiota bacterium]